MLLIAIIPKRYTDRNTTTCVLCSELAVNMGLCHDHDSYFNCGHTTASKHITDAVTRVIFPSYGDSSPAGWT